MWQEIINFINNDPTVSGIIASFFGNTMSTTISGGLKKLFNKKREKDTLSLEDCKRLIKEEDLAAVLEEIKHLKSNKIVISQKNEEGNNDNNVSGLAKADKNVEMDQTNIKGENIITLTF